MCEKICCGVLLVSIVCFASEAADPWKDSTLGMQAIVKREFIADDFPTPSVHASTLVEVAPGKLVAAWFGGTNEGTRDVGIWLSRSVDTWSTPIEVANGLTGGTQNPCWNPVLFKTDSKRLLLFYKVGPSPKTWWGVMRESFDEGVSFGDAVNLPERILGPVKNKPIQLDSKTIIAGSSSEGHSLPPVWQVHFERSTDGGQTFSRIQVPTQKDSPAAIQPSILTHRDGTLQAVGRTQSGRIFSTRSFDRGLTWSALELLDLPNPNSGTDAITLSDGRHLLVYNHTARGRSPLNIAVSTDGIVWKPVVTLESDPGEYSYPAIVAASDSLVHITYTWKRKKIAHVVIDPARLSKLAE